MAIFKKEDSTISAAVSGVNSILGEGSSFKGNVRIQGSMRVDGEFEGNLTVTESLIVGKSGTVKAEVEVGEAVVAGRVIGRIRATERVELQTGSRMEGDVFTQSFMIEDGVFFRGSCHMGKDEQAEQEEEILVPDQGGLGIVRRT
jgi:cytoskeletal protein CcmA (bactofilin family)